MLWAVNSNGGIVREHLEEQDDGGEFVGVVFKNGRPTDSEPYTRSQMQNYINGYSITNGHMDTVPFSTKLTRIVMI
jgi:hypothetical protein